VGSTRSELVGEQLETVFVRYGVPEAMLMDHGVPWWSACSTGSTNPLRGRLQKRGIELLVPHR
jgi:hypothetical protein